MNSDNNRIIATKPAALAAVSVLLIVLAGFIGHHFVSKGSEEVKKTFEDSLVRLAIVDNIGQLNKLREGNLLQIVVVADKNLLVKEISRQDSEFAALIGNLEAKELTVEEKAMLQEIKVAAGKFDDLQAKIVALSLAGRTQEAIGLHQAHDRVAGETAEKIRVLAKFQEKDAKVLFQTSQADYRRDVLLLVCTVVLLIVSATFAGLYIRSAKPGR